MILYKFWGSRSWESGVERGTCCDHCQGAGGAQWMKVRLHWAALAWARGEISDTGALRQSSRAGQLILETRHRNKRGRVIRSAGHMTPASPAVSVTFYYGQYLSVWSTDPWGGRNYSWIANNASQANYGSNLVGARIKVLHQPLRVIKYLGGAEIVIYALRPVMSEMGLKLKLWPETKFSDCVGCIKDLKISLTLKWPEYFHFSCSRLLPVWERRRGAPPHPAPRQCSPR